MARRTLIFTVEAVKFPGKDYFNSKRVAMMVLNAMKKEGNQMKKELTSTVEYWVHRPLFNYKMHYRGGNVYLDMVMYGSLLATRYWYFVNKGTSYRYVFFHPFYQAKTSIPGSFFTNIPGRYTVTKKIGGSYTADSKVQGISRRRIFHGIRPRNWTILLQDKHQWTFVKGVTDAIKRGLQPQ